MDLDTLQNILPLLKFLLVFGAIVFAIVRKFNIAITIGLGGLALGLLFGMNPLQLGENILWGVINQKTMEIMFLVYGIMTFSVLLGKTGHLQKFTRSVEQLIPSFYISSAMAPALVGLLPMPGGAIFSAPLVDELVRERGLTAEQKTFINHYFRHIWEYMLPIYPGVIMAAAMWEVSIMEVVSFQWPLLIFAVISGFVVVLVGIKARDVEKTPFKFSNLRDFFEGLWPFLLLISGVLFLPVNILIVVYSVIILLFLLHRVRLGEVWETLKEGFDWKMLLLIISVMVFKMIMENSGAARDIANTLIEFNLPLELIFFSLPFIVAMASGIVIAYVGIAFPILLPMLSGYSGNPHALMMVAYVGGFISTLLTPLHLCLVLTNQYFKSNLLKTYKYFIPAVLIVTAMVWGYYYLLNVI